MADGGAVAIRPNRDADSAAVVEEMKQRIWDLERLLGKQTMENEMLREALAETTKSKKLLFLNKRIKSREEGS